MTREAKDAPLATQTKEPRTVAKSITTPISNTRRKIVYVRDCQIVTEPVEETHIALLPVRYAVAKRGEEGPYRYTAGSLNMSLPSLTKARYVLRSLRRGFVYVYAQGKLHSFERTPGGYLRAHQLGPAGEKILINRAALIFPETFGEVAMAFSEHEWTALQCQRVEADQDRARSRTMQTFSLANPAKDAFDLNELRSQVDDYAGRTQEYDWSDEHAVTRRADSYVGLEKIAEGGQHVVALSDPIGITHDLTALIEHALDDIKTFVSDPDEPAQNASATDGSNNGNATAAAGSSIPSLAEPAPTSDATEESDPSVDAARARYRKKLIAETIGRLYERRVKPGTDPDKLAQLRLEHWKQEPANKGKQAPSIDEFHRDVVTSPSVSPGTNRLLKHVDEAARRAFLSEYDQKLAELRQVLEAHRLDRRTWLLTWDQPGDPQHLHSAWDTFDCTDLTDWSHFELTFARSIAGICISDSADTSTNDQPTGAQAKELDLYDAWVKTQLEKSPIYLALAGHPPLQQAVQGDESQNPAAAAPDRSGATLDGMANIVDDVFQRFPYTVGTDEIVHSLTVYLLTKPTKWRGAVADNIDAMLARIAGNEDAKVAIKAMMARYGAHVTARTSTLSEYKKWFVEAAGDPPGLSKSIDRLTKTGQLRKDGYISYEVRETTTGRRAIAGKGQPNPFRGWGTAGISAIAGLLYLVNLKMAVANFNVEERGESVVNLLSALAAIGSGINAGLMAFRTATPRAVSSLYRRLPYTRALSTIKALRLFGYGGAILTGATLGIHGGKLIGRGDTDAGLLYATSAIAATAGGSALTYASGALAGGAATVLLTPLGWLVVGVILVGGSIYLSSIGDDAKDSPVEQWLDACTFGKQQLAETVPFASLSDEMEALGWATYRPVLVESDWSERWGFPHYLAEATVFLPEYSFADSKLRIMADGKIIGHIPQESNQTGMMTKIAHYLEKEAGIRTVNLQVRYWPTPSFETPYTLYLTLPESSTKHVSDEQTIPGP